MSLKVKGSKVNSKNIYSEIDIVSDVVAPRKVKDKIIDEVGNFLFEQTLDSVGSAKSPVSGEHFKALSPSYREFKKKHHGPGIPNLELEGDMLDSLDFKKTADGIKIGHFHTSEAAKSDGHNNFSGKSSLPKRRYLPIEGQKYKRDIIKEVKKIIADNIATSLKIPEQNLKRIKTTKELYAALFDAFNTDSRQQVREYVNNSDEWLSLLKDLGLLELL